VSSAHARRRARWRSLVLRRALLQVQADLALSLLLAAMTSGGDVATSATWACFLYASVGQLQIMAAFLVSTVASAALPVVD
jgi:hypothetical protein